MAAREDLAHIKIKRDGHSKPSRCSGREGKTPVPVRPGEEERPAANFGQLEALSLAGADVSAIHRGVGPFFSITDWPPP
jgi:hypothetical protein